MPSRASIPATDCIVVPVNDVPEGYDYPPEVRFEFQEQDLDSYRRAADFLNFSNTDVVSLQHEYGIYGGPAGRHILGLLRDLRMPVVTTLHTILREPNHEQRCVMEELAGLSARLVAMSERGKSFLTEIYGVPEQKIDLIAHGIPNMPFVDPNFYKDQFGVEGKHVLLTFGLLAPNKGIEYVLRALPEVIREFPNVVYMVLGATHPNLVREQGESYRLSLERLAWDLGIRKHVIFYNRFVELHELTEFIGAADIYITPYLNPAQITSGTLAYAFGCGQAVISTPYWHAEELLADNRGVLVPFADSAAIAREICGLLRDEPRRHAMRKRAYLLGREMIWSHVALLYMESFQRARRSRIDVARQAAGDPHARRAALGTAPLAARPSAADDRLDGDVPARPLRHSEFRRGLLHRRQRPGLALDGAVGGDRAGLAGSPAGGDDVCRLPQRRLRLGEAALPQLPELRPPLAGRGRLGRLLRPGDVGHGGVHRPLQTAATFRPGPCRPSIAPCRPAPSSPRPAPGPPRSWERTSIAGGSAATGWSTRCATA